MLDHNLNVDYYIVQVHCQFLELAIEAQNFDLQL